MMDSKRSYGGTEESYDLDELQQKLTELNQEILVLSAVKTDINRFKHVKSLANLAIHLTLLSFLVIETKKVHCSENEIARKN